MSKPEAELLNKLLRATSRRKILRAMLEMSASEIRRADDGDGIGNQKRWGMSLRH